MYPLAEEIIEIELENIENYYEHGKSFDNSCDTFDFIQKKRGWDYLREMEENEEKEL
jgi:hypothetical protein